MTCSECRTETIGNRKTCSEKCMIKRNRRTQKERWQPKAAYRCRGFGCGVIYSSTAEGGNKYLCPACNTVPKSERQKASQRRTDEKRGKQSSGRMAAKEICNTRLEFADRSDPRKAIVYWEERPFHAAQLGVRI